MSITKPATYANSQVQIGDGASPEVFTDIKFIVKDSIKFAGESRKAIDGTRYNSPDGIVEKYGNPLLDPGDFEFSMYLAPDDPGQAALIAAYNLGTSVDLKHILGSSESGTANYTFTVTIESIIPTFPTTKLAEYAVKMTLTTKRTYNAV